MPRRPTKVISPEVLARWRREALRRKNGDTAILVDDWAERRLLEVINSHQALSDSQFGRPITGAGGQWGVSRSDLKSDDRFMVVFEDENTGCIYGTREECEDICDIINHVRNRPKGDAP